MEPFEDENIPLFTVGQVAEMLAVKQAFLRRIDELQVVTPQRSAGRQRRYTRVEIRVIRQVASMADEGMTMPAIRRIIELESRLAEVAAQRDELAARLHEVSSERARLTHRLNALLRGVSPGSLRRRRIGRSPSSTAGSSMVEGTGSSLPLAMPAHGLAQDLARTASSAAPGTTSIVRSAAIGPIRSRIIAASSADQHVRVGGDARLEHDEAARHLALELVGHPEDRAFGDRGVAGEHLFHLARWTAGARPR